MHSLTFEAIAYKRGPIIDRILFFFLMNIIIFITFVFKPDSHTNLLTLLEPKQNIGL